MRVTHAGLHLCRTGSFKMQDVLTWSIHVMFWPILIVNSNRSI